MYGLRRNDEGRANRVREIRSWVRESHGIPEETTVMVTELACTEPGCPPLETVVAVLHSPGDTRQAKVPLGLADVTRDHVQAMVFQPASTGSHGSAR